MTPLHLSVILIYLLSLFPILILSQSKCNSLTFTNKYTFDNCIDLHTLKATLHWTYNPTNSTLSMAFTAPPPNPDGWVSWALNPTGSGMVGAQAILAYKPNSNSPVISMSAYDIKSYHDINKGHISYNVTGLSSEESNGKVTIFATWGLHRGESKINHVWQVGPVVGGKPGMHEFQHDNLGSKMILQLGGEPIGIRVGSLSSNKSKAEALDSDDPHSNAAENTPILDSDDPHSNAAGDTLIKSAKFGLVLGALSGIFL